MNDAKLGQIYAVFAFLFWGALAPIYFKQVASVGPVEVLMHRVLWSFIILIPLLFLTNQITILKSLVKDIKKLKYLFLLTIFVSLNWLIFIWAVSNGKIIETALGYYINPLVNVLLGFLFFSERMRRNQYIAIFIAFIAVLFYKWKPNAKTKQTDSNTFVPIGIFHFYRDQNKLIKATEEISLSRKECELLAIFIDSPNQIIKRDELMKKVWEDHGVIVGRSLDTYISKLRKKLSEDDTIKITNVHGVGYKLEIN